MFKKISINLITVILKTLLSLYLFSIFSENITPVEYAPYGVSLIAIGFLTTMGGLGFAPAIIRSDNLSDQKFSTYVTLSIVIGLILSILLILISPSIENRLNVNDVSLYIKIVSPLILIKLVSMIYESMALRQLQINDITKIDFGTFIVFHFLAQILVIKLNIEIYYLIICVIFEELTRLILYKRLVRGRYNFRFKIDDIKEDVKFSSVITVNRILNYFNAQMDKLYVSNKIDANSFSGYSRIFQLTNYPVNIIGQVFDKIVYPLLCSESRSKRNINHFNISFSVFIIGCVGVFVCYLIDDYIFSFFLKGDWIKYKDVYYILIFLIPIRLVDRYCAVSINSIGKPLIRTFSQILFISFLIIGLNIVDSNITDIANVSVFSYAISAVFSFISLMRLTKNEK